MRIEPFIAGLMLGVIGTAAAATMRGSDVFSDVPAGAYYDTAIGEMYDIGVIKGNPDGTFNPGGAVSRADVAVMLKRLRDELTGNVDTDTRSSSRSVASTSRASSSSSSSSTASFSSYNPKGAIRFTTTELRVPENVTTKKITIAVVRTGGNEGTVTIDYTTGGGTATEGTDYTKASGTLTLENKETSKTFDIQIKDDGTNEGNETVSVTLSNPGNGLSLGTPSTTTMIITDDEAGSAGSSSSRSSAAAQASSGPSIGFSATQYSVAENGASLNITVTRYGSTSGNASVQYATSNGTGKSGSEYTSANGTLSFSSGETSKTFSVAVADDNSEDGTKTFNITLSNATGPSLSADLTTATVSIADNETLSFGSGSFKFSRSNYTFTENSGKATVTVQRTGGSATTASVNYSTTPGTAVAGNDYVHASGTLTFAPGEAAKIVTILLVKDSEADAGQSFSIDLTSPTGNVPLIDPYSASILME